MSEGQHVQVRPMPGRAVAAPAVGHSESGLKLGPVVPEIARGAPHIGIGGDMRGLADRRLAGRSAEQHRPPAFANGQMNRRNLGGMIRGGQVVHLHQVHPPGGVLAEDRVVPAGVSPRTPYMNGHHAHRSLVLPASCALKSEPSMGRLASTAPRAMPRMR